MGSIIKLEGAELDLFVKGLETVRDHFLNDPEWVKAIGPKVTSINPVHTLAETPELLGRIYRLHAKERKIVSIISAQRKASDHAWRIEALTWLGAFLRYDKNLKKLARRGPVSITLPDREGNDYDGGYFCFHNWISTTCMPNYDWTLGPKYGIRFTS